jgi:hypothetical protein
MKRPLDGIRVLDWTIWQQGPVASMMLADLGADVIKIEERTGGDPGRGVLRASGIDLSALPNFYFEAHNRGKRSLTLDLKRPEAREIVYRLAEQADVFVQNFRPVQRSAPALGYARSASGIPAHLGERQGGFGRRGPDAERPCMDYLGLARSGIMNAVGEPTDPPQAVQGAIADQIAGTMLAFGVMTALLVRERFGVAQEVDASLLGAMSWLQGLSVASRLMLGGEMPRFSRRATFNPLWNHYRCRTMLDRLRHGAGRSAGGATSARSSAARISRPTSASRRWGRAVTCGGVHRVARRDLRDAAEPRVGSPARRGRRLHLHAGEPRLRSPGRSADARERVDRFGRAPDPRQARDAEPADRPVETPPDPGHRLRSSASTPSRSSWTSSGTPGRRSRSSAKEVAEATVDRGLSGARVARRDCRSRRPAQMSK